MPIQNRQTRFLTEKEIKESPVLTLVWDRVATRYFKLADENWASSDLRFFSADQLLKIRVRMCDVR